LSNSLKRENARKRRWRNRRNFDRHMEAAIRHTQAARRSQDLWWAATLEVEAADIQTKENSK